MKCNSQQGCYILILVYFPLLFFEHIFSSTFSNYFIIVMWTPIILRILICEKVSHSHSSSPNEICFVFICEILINIEQYENKNISFQKKNNGVTKKRSCIIVKPKLKYKIRIEIKRTDLYKTKRQNMMETRRRNKWGSRN